MTISTQTFRFSYVSTGGTTYAYTNKILSENDLTVYVDDVLQTLSTHYTVSGVGEAAGGNVVFLVAPAAASVVLITKDGVEFTQETDYVENDAFPAESHESALDKLTNIAQKIWDYTRRSIKLPITSSLTDLELPTPEANKVIGWNAAADNFQNLALTGFGAISDEAYNSTTWDAVDEIAPSKNAVRDKLEAMISDTAYNSTTWNGVSTIAPSKNAVRDEFESMRATITTDFATAAEITTGTEAAKMIAPDQLKASGLTAQILSITGTVADNALTIGLNPCALDFRNATLTNGAPNTRYISAALSLVVPAGATLGTINAIAARLVLLAIDNAGTPELAVVNLAGGNNLDETTLISTTAIDTSSDAANVIYSTSARSNVPFRVVGFVDITEATAGTWATAPSTQQGAGGQALAALSSLGYGQVWQVVTRTNGTTYYNTTGRPIETKMAVVGGNAVQTITINGVVVEATNAAYSGSISGIVPPGASYMWSTTGSPTIVELR